MRHVVAALFLALACVAQESLSKDYYDIGAARLVASKNLLSQYAVQDKEFVVEYSLYNIGDKVRSYILTFHPEHCHILGGDQGGARR